MKNESLIAPKTKHEETGPQTAAVCRPPPCVWPQDSIIEDFVVLARRYSEAEDQVLVGAFLPLISAVFGRSVHIAFGRRIFPNLYCILVSPAGMRKSTTIDLVARIARSLLSEEAFIPGGATSVQALFPEYLKHLDKLWLIDEGNVILDNWARDAAGKGVALKVLALYDCPPWVENFLKHEKKEGKAIQEIPETSTSILLGATPVDARFSALETRDAMRWRFNYYVSEGFGRMIPWPLSYDSHELIEFTTTLEGLKDLKGEMRLSPQAFEIWKQLQVENRRQIEAVSGIDSASQVYGSVLGASPTKTLKLAMVFEACCWAKDRTRDWQVIQADTLDLASRHEAYCVAANKGLDGTMNRAEIQDEADAIDALNRELDALGQWRHRTYEPEPGYVASEFAKLCRTTNR